MKKEQKQNIILLSFLIILFLISLIGLSNFNSNYLLKQTIWITISLLIFLIIKKINIRIIFKYSFLIYLFNLLLLLLVLIIGRRINGSKAWFTFGMFSFQPSELMKISLSLIYYSFINNLKYKNDFKKIIIILLLFLFPSFLVFLEPDTGAIIIYLIIMLVALLNSNIKKRYLIIISTIFLLLSGSLIYLYFNNSDLIIKIFGTSIFYRLDRLIHFKDNYQLNQALIYIGSAGLYGHKNILYVPESHTDFIFSFLIGRYGIILGFIILLCYFVIDIILINKSKKNLLIKFFLYTFLYNQFHNILMNIGLLPIMGIPLSFLSYGGTNTIINMMFLGICLNKKARIN